RKVVDREACLERFTREITSEVSLERSAKSLCEFLDNTLSAGQIRLYLPCGSQSPRLYAEYSNHEFRGSTWPASEPLTSNFELAAQEASSFLTPTRLIWTQDTNIKPLRMDDTGDGILTAISHSGQTVG